MSIFDFLKMYDLTFWEKCLLKGARLIWIAQEWGDVDFVNVKHFSTYLYSHTLLHICLSTKMIIWIFIKPHILLLWRRICHFLVNSVLVYIRRKHVHVLRIIIIGYIFTSYISSHDKNNNDKHSLRFLSFKVDCLELPRVAFLIFYRWHLDYQHAHILRLVAPFTNRV